MDTQIGKKEIIEAVERAFRELESQKFALDQSAIVAITDVKGDIIYVNEKFCSISKYDYDELIGRNHRIINSGYHDKSFFQEMWKTIASGKVWKGDIRNRAKDGSLYWVATTITPFKDANSKPTMFVSIRFDITKQKNLEFELEKQLKKRDSMLVQLQEQNKQLEDFCHIISHNLRAPLSNLSMLSDLISESEDASEKDDYFNKIKQVSSFLQETFEELVSSLQIRNDVEVSQETVQFEEIFERIRIAFQAEIDNCEATIKTDFKSVPEVKYPKKYLESIIMNIFSNSLKYRSNDRPTEIVLRSYIENGWVCLECTDNGLGLNIEKHGDKLSKLRKTFHKHPQAKGFGLFITRTQVESMGGKIEVDAKTDVYFRIKIYLKEKKNENHKQSIPGR